MRRILIIAYSFPPMGGGGVQRVSKFVKYLPLFGYELTVLTRKCKHPYIADNSLMSELNKDLICYRTSDFDVYGSFKKLQRILHARRSSAQSRINSQSHRKTPDGRKGVLENARKIASKATNFVFIPDNGITWLPFAYHTGKKLLENNNLDFIFSSCPPFTNHIIGYISSRHSHGKWIADFRDEWTVTHDHRSYPSKTHWKIHRHLEQTIIKKAHLLITVSGGIRDKYLRVYEADLSKKWPVLTNGYAEDDFAGYHPENDEKFRVTYIGAFYGSRSPNCFLQAANDISRSDFFHDAEFNFVG
ncbi:hypothetical protein KAU04_07790 [bacterium]|nr:hypothetical protein [bacterium]